jgi:hypothetical protein
VALAQDREERLREQLQHLHHEGVREEKDRNVIEMHLVPGGNNAMVGIMATVGQRRQDRRDIKGVVGMTEIPVLKDLDMLLVMNGYLKLNYAKPGVGRTVSSTTARRTESSRFKTRNSFTLEIQSFA